MKSMILKTFIIICLIIFAGCSSTRLAPEVTHTPPSSAYDISLRYSDSSYSKTSQPTCYVPSCPENVKWNDYIHKRH